MSHKTFLAFSFLTAVILLLAGCAQKNEPVEMIPIETLKYEYDYDKAMEKFLKETAGFPGPLPDAEDRVLFYDVNGDGNDEMLGGCMRGSGMVHTDVYVYDAYNDKMYVMDFYKMHEEYGYDYHILSVEDEGVIIMEKHYYPKEYYPMYGYLTLENDKAGIEFFEQGSAEYEYADELYKEKKAASWVL